MLLRTADLVAEVRAWYDQMLFHRIYQRLNEFFAVDLSAQYFDILKDRLYTFPKSSRERKSAQTALCASERPCSASSLPSSASPLTSLAVHAAHALPSESVHLALLPTPTTSPEKSATASSPSTPLRLGLPLHRRELACANSKPCATTKPSKPISKPAYHPRLFR